VLLVVPTCSGWSFHILAAATLKARSPNFKHVLGTSRFDRVAERKMVEYPAVVKLVEEELICMMELCQWR